MSGRSTRSTLRRSSDSRRGGGEGAIASGSKIPKTSNSPWKRTGIKEKDELHLYESSELYDCTFGVGPADNPTLVSQDIFICALAENDNYCSSSATS